MQAEQTGSDYPIETLVPFITNSPEYLNLLKNALASEIDLHSFSNVNTINNHIQTLTDDQQASVYQTLLNQLYQNLFGRTTDEPGSDYWIPRLKSGEVTLARLVETLINGAIDQDQILLSYKADTSIRLLKSMLENGLITALDIQNKEDRLENWTVTDALTSMQIIFSNYASNNPQRLLQDLDDLENNLASKLFPESQNITIFSTDDPVNKGYPLSYNNNGQLLVVGQENGLVKNVQLSGSDSHISAQITDSKLHTQFIRDLHFNTDNSLLTVSTDQAVMHWTGLWSQNAMLQTDDKLRALDVHSSNQQLVFATENGEIYQWDLGNEDAPELIGSHNSRIYNVLYMSNDTQLVTAGADGKISIWNIDNNQQTILGAMDGAIYDLALTNDGRYLFAAGGDMQKGLITIWDLQDQSLIKTLSDHESTVTALALSPDMGKLVSGDKNGIIHFWDITDKQLGGFTERPTKSINNRSGNIIYGLAFHHTHPQIAVTDSGGKLTLWNSSGLYQLESISLIEEEPVEEEPVEEVPVEEVPVEEVPVEEVPVEEVPVEEVPVEEVPVEEVPVEEVPVEEVPVEEVPVEEVPVEEVPVEEDTGVDTVRGLAQLIFRSSVPLLKTDELLAQPELFSSAFTLNLDNETVACPNGGTYTYQFTDSNNDNQYQSVNDSFQVTTSQCQDANYSSDGTYTLAITSASETIATFNQFSITESSQTTVFSGTVDFNVQETLTNRNTELDSNNIQVNPDNSGEFTYNILQAEIDEDLISNEKTLNYEARLTVTGSSDNGEYLITPLSDLKLSDFENYPYTGKLRITSVSGVHQGIIGTLTVLNANQVQMDVDLDGNGIIEHTETYNWSSLSSSF